MKIIKLPLLIFSAFIFISSCQKELSFDVDGLARGTLKKASTGECLPSVVNGVFREDTVLNNSNFIDIQVDITNPGTYEIRSDSVNGYYFKGTGTLGVMGINTVRLYGNGKPQLAGTDAFTIYFDHDSCVVNVPVIGISTGAAVYTLEGSPGTCSGAIVNGTYTALSLLDITNTVVINVNVMAIGTYDLVTTLANGMLFTSSGVFTSTGLQSVTLNGGGMPLQAGNFNITASTGTNSCTFSITVLPATGGAAVYTLNGTPGNCSGAALAGTYEAGTALTSANTVTMSVTVVTAGTYSITTNTDNGISFSASGTFTGTGVQPVVLSGTGTPAADGTFNFTATGGLTSCTFSVVVSPVVVPNFDYVPETTFSNWSDKLVGGTAADTSYIQVSPNSKTINSISYRIFEMKELGNPIDTFYHRKNGGMYYQLYDDSYGFDNPFSADGLLLDSTQAVNATWTINLGSNFIGGTAATGKINCKITEKGATATIAGNAYTNIIKVQYTYNYNIGTADVAYALEEIWYAKGKGVIYAKVNDIPVTITDVWETTRIQVF